jgi:hypothetical protein
MGDLVRAHDKADRTYEVICISMYKADMAQLRAKVAELKRRGVPRMSMSRLIRIALAQIDVDTICVAPDEAPLNAANE